MASDLQVFAERLDSVVPQGSVAPLVTQEPPAPAVPWASAELRARLAPVEQSALAEHSGSAGQRASAERPEVQVPVALRVFVERLGFAER